MSDCLEDIATMPGYLADVTTADVGLPHKFVSWRDQQVRAIEATLDSPHRFVCHAMPTGSGKSVMYMGLSLITGGRTIVLTSTKGLQDQLTEDFSLCGLVAVKGRNSFDCSLGGRRTQGTVTCEDGLSLGCRDTKLNRSDADAVADCNCPYLLQYLDACRSHLVVSNYAYWMAINQHGAGLGAFDLLICDEAHDAAEHVSSALTATITDLDLDLLRQRAPQLWQQSAAWKKWAEESAAACEEMLKGYTLEVSSGLFSPDVIRRIRALKNLTGKLAKLALMGKGQWLVEKTREYVHGRMETGYRIGPVWGKEYSEQVLFRGIPKVLLVSATMLPKSLDMLGVNRVQMSYFDYKWQFPVERGPIIHIPTVKSNYKNKDEAIELQLEKIDEIVRQRLDRKGIIHTTSYERARKVVEGSQWAVYMITHTNARMEAQEAARQFREAEAPCVLVTPSMSTGYDFPLTDCEYQIILKAPYPDYSSELTRLRAESDAQYGHYVMAQELAQACGRGMRSAEDQCETFILDNTVERIIRWKPGLFPPWFRQLYRRRELIPAPPPPLAGV